MTCSDYSKLIAELSNILEKYKLDIDFLTGSLGDDHFTLDIKRIEDINKEE